MERRFKDEQRHRDLHEQDQRTEIPARADRAHVPSDADETGRERRCSSPAVCPGGAAVHLTGKAEQDEEGGNSGARRDDAREARDLGVFQFPVLQHLVHQVERLEHRLVVAPSSFPTRRVPRRRRSCRRWGARRPWGGGATARRGGGGVGEGGRAVVCGAATTRGGGGEEDARTRRGAIVSGEKGVVLDVRRPRRSIGRNSYVGRRIGVVRSTRGDGADTPAPARVSGPTLTFRTVF